jgi:hypothetical protein
VHAERVRCATLEHDNARLMEAYELLRLQYEAIRADRAATPTAAEHARRDTRR